MRKDELRVSDNFIKYMRYIGSYDDNNYTVYQFEDQSGNVGLHYQLLPELLKDKKAVAMARLFNTKMAKLNVGDIAIVMCVCREIQESGYDQSVMYLNVDRILKPLVRYEIVKKLYNGVMTEFAIEKAITDWSDISRNKYN